MDKEVICYTFATNFYETWSIREEYDIHYCFQIIYSAKKLSVCCGDCAEIYKECGRRRSNGWCAVNLL